METYGVELHREWAQEASGRLDLRRRACRRKIDSGAEDDAETVKAAFTQVWDADASAVVHAWV